ncbi:flagellar basal body P-ring formation chaperone FlgA [Buchnera aphidicola]|uniref:Flagella basal body P-ring formation protein FlgA n=1 Tax=Buchnera aphidicola str. USDA (Myzus persicae) TaxID=1009856 RepID=W0NZV8_BUCMP|nr:flagellar basal body P-ring formation chaperone FlgA [Buchnera aphidicola]AHG60051.1 Flga [Buchnera aphidicola str. USDA (Myzus persicae)]AHG60631.1 Flga [Buchnera aphidicola str. W106 (Myzus persicae)]AHG61203.1 Flga [Buchnera aphidicola str. G002 (Myzus persicae)]AHG61776.1 Flga [Buchnera aphidicola str. F009 (Myzus persicae)]WAI03264.1 MAG: flagellar basal body P-ring formation chaperone FlgA [Buchnera aphidicola (Myzus persicae)]
MILKKITISFFLLCLSYQVDALSLNEKLNDFFKKEYPFKKNRMHIIIRTPLKDHLNCKKPFFSILSNLRDLSLVDVLLKCDTRQYFLQVEIQTQGEYIVAKRKIPRGTKIQKSDLKILIGRLDMLPNNTYLKKEDVINRVNLRDIFPLQPITSFITRPFWLVQVNQQVKIIFKGDGFTISSIAKSLNNGAENEKVRIKTKNGKIITGIVNKNGEVIVSL